MKSHARSVLAATLFALALPSLVQIATSKDPLGSPWWLERWSLDVYAPWAFARLPRNSGEVLRGRDGWLFHAESLRYLRGDRRDGMPDAARASLDAVLDTHRQLSDDGVDLLVVLVPPKAAVLDARQAWAETQWRGLASWQNELEARGVQVVDLTDFLRALPPPRYLEHDTHWRPATARAAAGHVAEVVERLGLRPDLPRSEFDHREVSVEARGDLAELLPGGSSLDGEELALTQVAMTFEGGAPTGDASSPVLLLGDSFTLAFSDPRLGLGRQAGFGEHLGDALGLPLDVIAIPGGAATQARRAWAARGSGKDGKSLVIWQIAQRDLLRARDGWHPVDLSGRRTSTSTEQAAVRARIRLLPHELPSTIDYADCLALLPFEPASSPTELPERFTVGAWGWRDFESLAPLALRPGDELEVTLVPLEQAVSLETTCWMGDLGEQSYFASEGL